MKIKTSITLSDNILNEIDKILNNSGNRSIFIENAVKYYLQKKKKDKRNKKDLEIINNNSDLLNEEAEDVLSFQVNL